MKEKKFWLITSERIITFSRQILIIGIVACGLAWSAVLVYAAPGDVDMTFGTGGKVFMPINQYPSRVIG